MAKSTTRSGKRASVAERSQPRTRKSGGSEAPGSRQQHKLTESAAPKQKPSRTLSAAGLKSELEAARFQTKEALERQNATAEILKVIASSPSDVQPVFEAIAQRSNRLVNGLSTAVYSIVDDVQHIMAFTPINRAADAALTAFFPAPLSRFIWGETIRAGKIYRITDTETEIDESGMKNMARLRGWRSLALVPLLRGNKAIGLISVTRKEPGSFATHHVQLLQTFADQAVIAIENTRLFNETQEALERQTATADILKVIASSPSDTQPVFEAIVQAGLNLFPSSAVMIVLADEGVCKQVAIADTDSKLAEMLRRAFPVPLTRDYMHTVAILDGRVVDIPDAQSGPDEFLVGCRAFLSTGHRAITIMPMMRGDQSIGALSVVRRLPGSLGYRQLELLKAFADQAVIAIENTRLLRELRERTSDLSESLRQQTATADVLKVISASPGELGPVFETMLENAVRLCEAKFAMMRLLDGEQFRAVATWNLPQAFSEFLGQTPIQIDPKLPLGRVANTKQPVHVHDVLQHEAYIERYPGMVALAEIGGGRTLLQVPMLKEDHLVGTIGLYRQDVRPFTDKQIALVQSFAAQAVIAIENARLLNELRQRTNDLSKSLDDLRATQDRLVQTEKLASLGQLTAGIAHEIKNPLNFVNNFSALSVELTDELSDALKQERLTDKGREETDALTGLLKENLSKVLQHGKRADSIVKNMLLHSREGSGERRSVEINRLVEESLHLAYHGARAEKAGFSITLKHDLDPEAGALDLYPQEITRALLNLISNAFYATTKRKAEAADGAFEPIVSAATRNLGESIEIRIRDNGTGIPPEVREKMFNPFFTTKPTGEGTGLGLSMTHDIIVKQHGGRIDVETEPGAFTEFIITLPRGSSSATRPKSE